MGIKLLDCTLRDGGYINDWKFGYRTAKSIIQKLVDSNADYVEVGFLRNCSYDKNATLFNNIAELKKILPREQKNTKFTVMALHNKYDITKLEPNDGTVEAVRVTFHDYDIDEGLEFVKKVMEKGYKCFCNPINIMGYSDQEILNLIQKINQIKPYAFSIVDTFGSMIKSDLLRIYSLLEHNLDKSIVIGLHLHENLSLSYSLAQEFIGMRNVNRDCVIDGSLMGMGRVPGNLCLEFIMDYINKYDSVKYNVDSVLDAIDDHILAIRKESPWGYTTEYSLSAKYNLHRNYAEYLIGKGQLKAKDINHILSNISKDKKTAFDEAYIERLYLEYQDKMIDDEKSLNQIEKTVSGRKILLLAPGSSLKAYPDKIRSFIEKEQPLVISVNFESSDFKPDYVFFSNRKRYDDYQKEPHNVPVLATSNVITSGQREELIFNYHDLAFSEHGIFDNSMIMLLRLMSRIHVDLVSVAGFDGFERKKNNYVDTYYKTTEKGLLANEKIASAVSELKKEIKIEFLTPSLFQ